MNTDLSYLLNMTDGNPELLKEMIGIFIEQFKELSDGMQNALEEERYTELSKIAHKAKSSVAIMGMEQMAKKLKKLELYASKGTNREKYHEIIEEYNHECSISVAELEQYMKNL
ncbi:MAG: Hpt domain-containing protein [Bacteroidales bacterium]